VENQIPSSSSQMPLSKQYEYRILIRNFEQAKTQSFIAKITSLLSSKLVGGQAG